MAHHSLVRHPLVLRRVEVARVVDVTPRMRRVTLIGAELAAFVKDGLELPAFVSPSFDDHVKLVFAADGDIAAALPVQRARSIDWPPSEHRRGRDYTPRRWDPAAGELDLDFVLHGDGPAARWAGNARPGDRLHFAGPKSSLVLPDDIDWILLAGDETALPAIGRFLDERPIDVPAEVIVEIRDEAARQELNIRDGDAIRWVETPESAPSALPAAVQDARWRAGTPYVWAAGESRSLVPLRGWLRRDRGLPPSHVNVTGYWHAETTPTEQEGVPPDAETVLSPLPWLATRSAVELGVLDRIGGTPVPLPVLARELAIDVTRLRALVAYLAEIEVVTFHEHHVTIGRLGEELVGDEHLYAELFGTGVEARTLTALPWLASALRRGGSAWHGATSRSLADDIETDRDLYADRVEAAGAFAFVAEGVVDLPTWKEASSVTITGPGSLELAAAAERRGVLPEATIGAPPVPLEVLGERSGLSRVSVVADTALPPADLVVSTLELAYRGDDELGVHLRRLARFADQALVIDALDRTGPGSGSVAAEHDLLRLAGTGVGSRQPGDVERIAAANGWRLVDQVALGWDHLAFALRR